MNLGARDTKLVTNLFPRLIEPAADSALPTKLTDCHNDQPLAKYAHWGPCARSSCQLCSGVFWGQGSRIRLLCLLLPNEPMPWDQCSAGRQGTLLPLVHTLDLCRRMQIQLHAPNYGPRHARRREGSSVLWEMAILAVCGHAGASIRLVFRSQSMGPCEGTENDSRSRSRQAPHEGLLYEVGPAQHERLVLVKHISHER